MPPEHRPRPGRRTLLAAAATAWVGALAGCGIRLEDDAPRVPLVPARTPVPAEDLLVGLTLGSSALADLAAALPGNLAADLADLHRRQAAVLDAALRSAGVPSERLTPSPAASATPSASPSPSRAGLARAERAAADGADRFAEVDPSLVVTVTALHAQRWAAATLLGSPAPPLAPDATDGLSDATEPLGRLADGLAGVGYFLEVVQARVGGDLRQRAADTREVLDVVQREVRSAAPLDPPALGHPLPFAVDGVDDARRLARTSLEALRSMTGGLLEPLVADGGPAGLVAATRWLGTVEVEAHRWGVPLEPFPGLA